MPVSDFGQTTALLVILGTGAERPAATEKLYVRYGFTKLWVNSGLRE